jgi:hypothetical protein
MQVWFSLDQQGMTLTYAKQFRIDWQSYQIEVKLVGIFKRRAVLQGSYELLIPSPPTPANIFTPYIKLPKDQVVSLFT